MRCLFLAEGSSDSGISGHVERIAASRGVLLNVTIPDFYRLEERVGSAVSAKLKAAVDLGGDYDIVAIHRDSDNAGAEARRHEIVSAISTYLPNATRIPIVPVRMTEAWLLLDEGAIRLVAGNPNGRCDLNLPTLAEAERIADPKLRLKTTIAKAGECSGRKLKTLNRRFDENRAQLLELLDPDGFVKELGSWKRFVSDVEMAIGA